MKIRIRDLPLDALAVNMNLDSRVEMNGDRSFV
jgi:hypothetical protein